MSPQTGDVQGVEDRLACLHRLDVEDRLACLHRLATSIVDFCWMPTNLEDIKKAASLSDFPFCTCFQGKKQCLIESGVC